MNYFKKFWILYKTHSFIFLFTSLCVLPLFAQDIVTGIDFFDQVAANYSQIQDYIASVDMLVDGNQMTGTIYYKYPNRIRIDFLKPNEQVIVSDGNILQIYIPDYDVTLTQRLGSQSNPGSLVSGRGLELLRKDYQIAFKDSPELQPISPEDSSEMVYKLFLTWDNTAQAFREIVIDVTQELFIRKMTALTTDYKEIVFSFTNLRINQGLPDTRFDYDSPPSSNIFDNFIYGGE